MMCEKCWADAGGSYDAYRAMLTARVETPCTPEEQCGERHLIDPTTGVCRCGKITRTGEAVHRLIDADGAHERTADIRDAREDA